MKPEELKPVARFVDVMVLTAVHQRASAIRIESSSSGLAINFVIEGVMHKIPDPPRLWQNLIIAHIKALALLDLAGDRVSLEGRFQQLIAKRPVNVSVSTQASELGESILMRLSGWASPEPQSGPTP